MSNETIPQKPNPRKVNPADIADLLAEVRQRIEAACIEVMVASDDVAGVPLNAAQEHIRNVKADLHDALVWLHFAENEVTP